MTGHCRISLPWTKRICFSSRARPIASSCYTAPLLRVNDTHGLGDPNADLDPYGLLVPGRLIYQSKRDSIVLCYLSTSAPGAILIRQSIASIRHSEDVGLIAHRCNATRQRTEDRRLTETYPTTTTTTKPTEPSNSISIPSLNVTFVSDDATPWFWAETRRFGR